MAPKKAQPNFFMDDWADADHLILLESWARDGLTVQDIANRIGITTTQLRVWMGKCEDIKKAINQGRELVDYKVENALLKAALGYRSKETTVRTTIRGGRIIETVKETVEKEAAPNVSACRLWLLNRKPNNWKPEKSLGIIDGLDEDTSIHITVERANSSADIKKTSTETANTSADSSEVDQEWQEEIANTNTSISIRQATPEEKAEAEKKKEKKQKAKARMEKTLVEYEEGEPANVKHRKSQPKKSAVYTDNKHGIEHTHTHTTVDTDDVDYWPDDWTDE